ncbi:glycerol-3-phosphate dehydrogenase/oxidase [Raineyella fluvialis]|uniref:Glycerol-3-phosphate dehydrogenase n=1 Tax=Raineyella fluvialis TaxID=2662261 RepID=A0A5Q2FC01_9ACTN|nr:glycerol-3-phosphate dehydrogenase/oxidase [Raineyella fluvialis]QGF23247.1 FAD-dependent oxidoreductase [Raineyella fluvialis]
MDTALNAAQRATALEQMADDEGIDVLVVGGGVTGAGIALDAATRGLRTAIVEAQDWAAGTSSRSSRLVHGGLRYLYQLDVKLVAEALHERGLLLTTLAPHLVKPQPLIWPFKIPVIERAYSTLGVGMYDAMAVVGAGFHQTVPIQRHLSKKETLRRAPALDPRSLVGAMEYYDAKVDDARLVVTLVRTAVRYGALAANRTAVVGFAKDDAGRVVGATLRDLETGVERDVRATTVINATGVWTEKTQQLAGADGGLKVLASKGIHIVVPRDRIQADAGMFLRTEKSVLFIIPWPNGWMIGTTDTAWHEQLRHPVPTSADIDYVLEQANNVLADKLTRDDIIGTWAGLRPLLQPGTLDDSTSAKVSREHTVTQAAPGMVVIAGGKLTTYRVMAADAVDFALGRQQAKERPSITDRTPLLGAAGLDAVRSRVPHLAKRYGWTEDRVQALLDRYGSDLPAVLALVDADPTLRCPLSAEPRYTRAEVAFACTHEGALHLEDVLTTRVRLNSEHRDRGASAVDEVAALVAPLLGWDEDRTTEEKDNYLRRVRAELDAEAQATDAAAAEVRAAAPSLVPMGV